MATKDTRQSTKDMSTKDAQGLQPWEEDPYAEYNLSYDELLDQQHDTSQGAVIIENPEELVRVPFLITRVTYRPTEMSDAEYVSLECVAKDLGRVVKNDGSTGIRRQVTNYFIGKGVLIPKLPDDLAELAEDIRNEMVPKDKGDWPMDWFDFAAHVEVRFDPQGNRVLNIPCRLNCPRGLRKSEYDWTDPVDGKKKKATTWYLA